ncbi:ECF transporter S component [Moorella sulfitireducens]|uniref:ECF transporter S component n=1 Tax=Neomoorella sulfitireducens TaxID=2972948 RepID=UPI0021AD2C64|nr:ECF transporter S component [Moorella sulfitireducens]
MCFWKKAVFPFLVVCIVALLLVISRINPQLFGQGWGLIALVIIVAAIILFYWRFEQRKASSREVAVVAVLGTIAAAGRIPFAVFPSIQPVTFIVIVSGYIFGPQAGFMAGSTAALVSNFFLGQGPWTPWQMLAWGLAGASAGLMGKYFPTAGKTCMTLFCVVWGYLFGWILNLWTWAGFINPLNWQSFVATCAASFWFDTFHAAGNAVFYLFFGPSFIKILRRYHRKLKVVFLPDANCAHFPHG